MRSVLVSAIPVHEARATPVQELSYALGATVTYFRKLDEMGLAPQKVADQLRLAFSVRSDFFMQVAKLRAMRVWLAKVFAALEVSPERARLVPIHARTSLRNKTTMEPWLDLSKIGVELLAAILGGANSVTPIGLREADAPVV